MALYKHWKLIISRRREWSVYDIHWKLFCFPSQGIIRRILDIHYSQFPLPHSLLDHSQLVSTLIMNGGHYFSVFILNLIIEIDTVDFYILIKTHSAIGPQKAPLLLIPYLRVSLVSSQIPDLQSGSLPRVFWSSHAVLWIEHSVIPKLHH